MAAVWNHKITTYCLLISFWWSARSDVLPVAAGSAAASMALIRKQLHSLGMPDWEDFSKLSRTWIGPPVCMGWCANLGPYSIWHATRLKSSNRQVLFLNSTSSSSKEHCSMFFFLVCVWSWSAWSLFVPMCKIIRLRVVVATIVVTTCLRYKFNADDKTWSRYWHFFGEAVPQSLCWIAGERRNLVVPKPAAKLGRLFPTQILRACWPVALRRRGKRHFDLWDAKPILQVCKYSHMSVR